MLAVLANTGIARDESYRKISLLAAFYVKHPHFPKNSSIGSFSFPQQADVRWPNFR
jgi:hypothetical protein